MNDGFSKRGPTPKNSYESWRSDPVYGPGRGGLTLFWWVILLGIGIPVLWGILAGWIVKILDAVYIPLGVGLLFFTLYFVAKDQQQRLVTRNAVFEYWFYHRDSDTWIPANGPNAFRAWWSLDWNRWLTQDEVQSQIPFTTGFNVRLKVFDGNNRAAQVWRDECEVWTIHPALNKRTVTSIPRCSIGFMKF